MQWSPGVKALIYPVGAEYSGRVHEHEERGSDLHPGLEATVGHMVECSVGSFRRSRGIQGAFLAEQVGILWGRRRRHGDFENGEGSPIEWQSLFKSNL